MADNEREFVEKLRKLPDAAQEQIVRMVQGGALVVDALRESGLLDGAEEDQAAMSADNAAPEAVTC